MSVYVKFDEWGRMGNRMFQYAFGYILAKEKRTDLLTSGLPNFNIKPTINSLPINNFINTRIYGNNYVDWKALVNTDKDIIVDSFVQQQHYYMPYKNELRQIFNVDSFLSINQNKLILHIRETDYVQVGCFLEYKYYKQIINKSEFTEIIIVTDNSNCETVQKLLSAGCTLNTKGYVDTFNVVSDDRAMTDFYTLLYSENIAISQSSFSWWAAFLGNHKKIVFPITEKGMWKQNPNQDDINLYF